MCDLFLFITGTRSPPLRKLRGAGRPAPVLRAPARTDAVDAAPSPALYLNLKARLECG